MGKQIGPTVWLLVLLSPLLLAQERRTFPKMASSNSPSTTSQVTLGACEKCPKWEASVLHFFRVGYRGCSANVEFGNTGHSNRPSLQADSTNLPSAEASRCLSSWGFIPAPPLAPAIEQSRRGHCKLQFSEGLPRHSSQRSHRLLWRASCAQHPYVLQPPPIGARCGH